tara:strand:+ start:163 stop:1128 length:966 start_codon:yes stop_codon:yes gene_type:complete
MENNITGLHKSAVLVRFITRHWSGKKVDRNIIDEVATAHGASPDVISVSKKIMGYDVNKEFRRIQAKFRNNVLFPLTLPWHDSSEDDDGSVLTGQRLCPSKNFAQLELEFNKYKADWEKEVKGFLDRYTSEVNNAQNILGTAFNRSDYPEVYELESKFKFHLPVETIPHMTDDIRLAHSKDVADRIEADVTAKIRANVQKGMTESMTALSEICERLSSSLDNYDPKNKAKHPFRDSGVEILRQQVSVLTTMNKDVFGNRPEINSAHDKIVRVLAKFSDTDELRQDSEESAKLREEVSKGLAETKQDINTDVLGKMFGGSNE